MRGFFRVQVRLPLYRSALRFLTESVSNGILQLEPGTAPNFFASFQIYAIMFQTNCIRIPVRRTIRRRRVARLFRALILSLPWFFHCLDSFIALILCKWFLHPHSRPKDDPPQARSEALQSLDSFRALILLPPWFFHCIGSFLIVCKWFFNA